MSSAASWHDAMTVEALIMAGGRSSRMRERGDTTHKALVPLNGVALVEHCLSSLLRHGFRSIAISISSREPNLLAFARDRLSVQAARSGGRLECIVESAPLGTIGVAGELRAAADSLLVVNADNVSDLDLRELVAAHRSSGAAMTIATHRQPFPMPFGELDVRDGIVCAYREKPVYTICISSGTYVLSADARGSIAAHECLSAPELYERLRRRGLTVAAYEHQAAWIDVNDARDLTRAEQLFGNEPVAAGLRRANV